MSRLQMGAYPEKGRRDIILLWKEFLTLLESSMSKCPCRRLKGDSAAQVLPRVLRPIRLSLGTFTLEEGVTDHPQILGKLFAAGSFHTSIRFKSLFLSLDTLIRKHNKHVVRIADWFGLTLFSTVPVKAGSSADVLDLATATETKTIGAVTDGAVAQDQDERVPLA